jgi:cysteinyl-tRNA synthetase
LILHKNHPINSDQWQTINTMLEVFIHEVLGIAPVKEFSDDTEETLNKTVELLIKIRNKARAQKDFETSDNIRDQLLQFGVQLKDGKDGTQFTLN